MGLFGLISYLQCFLGTAFCRFCGEGPIFGGVVDFFGEGGFFRYFFFGLGFFPPPVC